MGYRQWPAALLAGTSLAAASLVVGEHVVTAADGCLEPSGWFTATPVSGVLETTGSGEVGLAGEDTIDGPQISGCMDVDRIEIPGPAPAPDGRA